MNLKSPVQEIAGIGPNTAEKLKKLDIDTIWDLLLHVPIRYQDYSKIKKISEITADEEVSTKASLISITKTATKRGIPMIIANFEDKSGNIVAIWFNQPYLIATFRKGGEYFLSGKVGFFARKLTLVSPYFEIVKCEEPLHTARLVPVYPLTQGLTSKTIRKAMSFCLKTLKNEIKEPYPPRLIKDYELSSLRESVKNVHFPKNFNNASKARKRLAFDELVRMHTTTLIRKENWKKNMFEGKIQIKNTDIDKFTSSLPYKLTEAQKRTIGEILADMKKNVSMNRLLEGDVGSGKTVVASIAAYAVFKNSYQSVFMAPTQILAEQHFNTLKNLLHPFNIKISLATSKQSRGKRNKPDIIVGTQALLFNKVSFEKVGLIVIDEQHKFGVKQRQKLVNKAGQKNISPHILTMTATPIPRTVAMTAYGNMDLSIIDQLPKGRQKIITWHVPRQKREASYNWIKERIKKEKIQVFVVCPLIEESDKETMSHVKSAKKEYEKLKKVFDKFEIGLLHGKMRTEEKNTIIRNFKNRKLDIIISTPVIEVGVDMPNANIIVIETAERFGLAQLHQLRGRVGRGKKRAYCLLYTEKLSEKTIKRMDALKKESSGFILSEIDLKLRGPGEILGSAQHGFPQLKAASWGDSALIKKTRKFAETLFESFPKYSKAIGENEIKV